MRAFHVKMLNIIVNDIILAEKTEVKCFCFVDIVVALGDLVADFLFIA